MTTTTNEFRVMTSGAFTAAYKALIPQLERLTGKTVVTVTTSIGTGDSSIPNRLKRGEVADIVIVADGVLRQFIADGLVLADDATTIARSMMGFAVRAGAPDPAVRNVEDLRRALLAAGQRPSAIPPAKAANTSPLNWCSASASQHRCCRKAA